MRQQVTVRVPATSANLGPGFDSMGMALAIAQDVTLSVEHHTEIVDGLSRLVLDAARSAYRLARVEVPQLTATGRPTIPIGRGLGASAAARAAGIVGANALMGGVLNERQLLWLGAGLEGHADNMAPALFGGLRIVVRDDDRYRHIAVPIAPGLKVVLFVPDFEMPTAESRKLLPAHILREDAVRNIGRAAMLSVALAKGEWEMLGTATEDRLHQPSRAKLFPGMQQIMSAARAAGAAGTYLSGSGSTIAALTIDDEDQIAAAMVHQATILGYSGASVVTAPSDQGAVVVG